MNSKKNHIAYCWVLHNSWVYNHIISPPMGAVYTQVTFKSSQVKPVNQSCCVFSHLLHLTATITHTHIYNWKMDGKGDPTSLYFVQGEQQSVTRSGMETKEFRSTFYFIYIVTTLYFSFPVLVVYRCTNNRILKVLLLLLFLNVHVTMNLGWIIQDIACKMCNFVLGKV